MTANTRFRAMKIRLLNLMTLLSLALLAVLMFGYVASLQLSVVWPISAAGGQPTHHVLNLSLGDGRIDFLNIPAWTAPLMPRYQPLYFNFQWHLTSFRRSLWVF